MFSFADVALVTSLRDGMNLVSYEFVACQDAKKGVLILSEVMAFFFFFFFFFVCGFAYAFHATVRMTFC